MQSTEAMSLMRCKHDLEHMQLADSWQSIAPALPDAWSVSIVCTATYSVVQRLSEVGTGLRGLGTSMFTGTRELLETVTDAISSELDSIEGMSARNKPRHSQSADRCSVAVQPNAMYRYTGWLHRPQCMGLHSGTFSDTMCMACRLRCMCVLSDLKHAAFVHRNAIAC